jgi:hypothetical protein
MQCSSTLLLCHLWTVSTYQIFPHYLINSTIFGEKLLKVKRVFWFFYNIVWNISHSKKNSAKCYKCTPFPREILFKLESSIHIVEISSNFEDHENLCSGSGVVPCRRTEGRTDRRKDMTKLIVKFRNLQTCLKNPYRFHTNNSYHTEHFFYRGNGSRQYFCQHSDIRCRPVCSALSCSA